MNLRDYVWFNNPRGLHNIGVYQQLHLQKYFDLKLGWAKLVTGGTEYIDPYSGFPGGLSMVQHLIANRIMPVIRVFRSEMVPMRLEEDPKGHDWYGDLYPRYIAQGAKWFEYYNEPNLYNEWKNHGSGMNVTWSNPDRIREMMDTWIDWAEKVALLGGYPGFPALADSSDAAASSILWLRSMLTYLRDNHAARFRWLIGNGLYVATHPYLANHFYQEPAGGPSYAARPPEQQRANEGGWHFEYPYDPLQQKDDPGRTPFGGTPITPYGDPNGLIASGMAFQQMLWHFFRAGPVPVLGTEGGIWRVPKREDPPHIIDTRYPGYTYDSHAEATMALWRWIAEKAPPWFFGLTLWIEQDYLNDSEGWIPAVRRMMSEPPIYKQVPDIVIRTGE